eukprot:COSAG04_NODE_1586_length_6232_cov_11.344367_8_plen_120_part_00
MAKAYVEKCTRLPHLSTTRVGSSAGAPSPYTISILSTFGPEMPPPSSFSAVPSRLATIIFSTITSSMDQPSAGSAPPLLSAVSTLRSADQGREQGRARIREEHGAERGAQQGAKSTERS